MQSKVSIATGLCLMASWSVGGCAPIRFAVPIDTGGTSLGTFDLTSGTPGEATASFADFNPPVTIGNGSFELDPSAISITPADSTGSKKLGSLQQASCVAQEEAQNVLDTCQAAGTTAEECQDAATQAVVDCLGDANTLEITCWINETEADVFTNGDEYGPYRVTFDDSGQGTSVSPTSVELTTRTIGLLNSGTFGIGCKMVIGQDATATLDSFVLNLGP